MAGLQPMDGFLRVECLSAMLLLSVVAWSGKGLAAEPSATCAVARLVGTATVLRGGTSLPLRLGAVLRQDDQVITGDGSRLAIACSDGSSFVVGERCSLSLTAFDDAGQGHGASGILDLIEGILRIALSPGPAWDGFAVRTATATAAVRSTEWVVEAVPGNTAVFVVEGAVSVSGRAGGQVVLRPGFGTDVRAGAAPTEPKRWGAARAESALARTRLP